MRTPEEITDWAFKNIKSTPENLIRLAVREAAEPCLKSIDNEDGDLDFAKFEIERNFKDYLK